MKAGPWTKIDMAEASYLLQTKLVFSFIIFLGTCWQNLDGRIIRVWDFKMHYFFCFQQILNQLYINLEQRELWKLCTYMKHVKLN